MGIFVFPKYIQTIWKKKSSYIISAIYLAISHTSRSYRVLTLHPDTSKCYIYIMLHTH